MKTVDLDGLPGYEISLRLIASGLISFCPGDGIKASSFELGLGAPRLDTLSLLTGGYLNIEGD